MSREKINDPKKVIKRIIKKILIFLIKKEFNQGQLLMI